MDLAKQKEALLKLRDEYTGLLDTTRSRDRSELQSEEAGMESDIPTHDADAGTETFERERDEAFAKDYASVLTQIERALEKIDDGSYGRSDLSGKAIPDERLEVQPYAVLTIEEQELQESM